MLSKDSTFDEMLNVINGLPVNPRPGATGNAQTGDVLDGKTFSNIDANDLVGTMPNNDSQTATITTQGGTKVIPAGYTTGGTVTASFANLVAGNVKSGVNIGGVTGGFSGAIKSSSGSGSHVTSTMGSYLTKTGLSFRPVFVYIYMGGQQGFGYHYIYLFDSGTSTTSTKFVDSYSNMTRSNATGYTITNNGFSLEVYGNFDYSWSAFGI